MADEKMVEAWDFAKVMVPRASLKPFGLRSMSLAEAIRCEEEEEKRDPFGSPFDKPSEKLVCRVVTVHPDRDVDASSDVIPRIVFDVHTIDRRFLLSMDERSSRFVQVILSQLLCPYSAEAVPIVEQSRDTERGC